MKQKAAVSGRPQNVAFAVRAAGYDEELIKTAVGLHGGLVGFAMVMEFAEGLEQGASRHV